MTGFFATSLGGGFLVWRFLGAVLWVSGPFTGLDWSDLRQWRTWRDA